MADMPSFINSNDWISPRSLYETYLGRDMQGLTSVQFLTAFNRFLGGDREVSRNAMSEFFHNISWQALTNDSDSVKIKFEAITELVKSINSLLQQRIYESKKRAIVTNYSIQKKLLEKEAAQLKTDNEIVEQKVVTDKTMTKHITHRDIIFRLLRLTKKLRETEQMKTKITLLLN